MKTHEGIASLNSQATVEFSVGLSAICAANVHKMLEDQWKYLGYLYEMYVRTYETECTSLLSRLQTGGKCQLEGSAGELDFV